MQRVGYPALAYVLAAGQTSAIPWSLLGINVVVVLLITAVFAVYVRARGLPGWWALAVGFMSGFLASTLRDLSDPLAVAAMLAGMLAWRRGAQWWAALLLALAALAREPMLLAVAAIAVDGVVSGWRSRAEPGAWRRGFSAVWPVLAVPVLAYVGWQVYVSIRYGGSVASPGSAYKPPLVGLLDEVRHALDDPQRRDTLWDLAYLGLIGLGILAAIDLVRRRVTAVGVAATLFGLSLLILVFGDPWSYTRLSAPMFAMLLLGGLEQRSRPALAICAAAAALTVVVPFVPWLAAA